MTTNKIIKGIILDLEALDIGIKRNNDRCKLVVYTTSLPEDVSEIRPMRDVKREYIINALDICDGNVSLAARMLKMTRKTVDNYKADWKNK